MLLFGREYSQRIIDLDALVDEGTIDPEDLTGFGDVEQAEEEWDLIRTFYDGTCVE